MPHLQAEPSNKDVRALKLRYKKESAAANAKDRAMYARAFQKLAKLPDTDPKPQTYSKPDPQSHPLEYGAYLPAPLCVKFDTGKAGKALVALVQHAGKTLVALDSCSSKHCIGSEART